MAKTIKRNDLIAAPIVAGVVGVFTFFILFSLAGFGNMPGSVAGLDLGFFISIVMAVIVAAVLFGELLSRTLNAK
jgi:hypothetical protein